MQHEEVTRVNSHPMNQAPVFGTVQFILDGEEVVADLRYLKIRRGYNLGDADAASSPFADFELQPGETMVHIGATRREERHAT